MAKTIANLTNEEMMIITDYVELFGITEEEALSQAISEGSISDSVGGNFKYKPDGFNELKFYKVDPKSAMYKLNKELKKNKKTVILVTTEILKIQISWFKEELILKTPCLSINY